MNRSRFSSQGDMVPVTRGEYLRAMGDIGEAQGQILLELQRLTAKVDTIVLIADVTGENARRIDRNRELIHDLQHWRATQEGRAPESVEPITKTHFLPPEIANAKPKRDSLWWKKPTLRTFLAIAVLVITGTGSACATATHYVMQHVEVKP